MPNAEKNNTAKFKASPIIRAAFSLTPAPLRGLFVRHQELIKFATVGFTTMIIDSIVFYSLTLTVMYGKPTLARIISSVVAMIVSYFLNSRWTFNKRGGRERRYEVFLFFFISGIGIFIGAAPEFVVSNLTNLRPHSKGSTSEVIWIGVLDFLLNYIIGNILQLAFRFWALRKFAFPETTQQSFHNTPATNREDETQEDETQSGISHSSSPAHGTNVTATESYSDPEITTAESSRNNKDKQSQQTKLTFHAG